MSGWFPRYSPAGVITNEWPGHWRAQWLHEGVDIYDNGRVLVIGGKATEFPTCNELSAAGGRWAAFRSDPPRVFTSDGQTIPGAGCPAITASHFAYVDDQQADVKNLVLNGTVVARGGITDVRLSTQALVWSDNGRTWGLQLADRIAWPIQEAPLEFRPIPIDTPDGPWVLNHTATGIILRLFDEHYGYRFDNGGQTYYPDAVYFPGNIYVAFSDERGELTQMRFPITAPRVDLRVPATDKQPGPINTTPAKDTPTMPIFPNRLDVVSRERDKYGASLDAAACFAVTNAVASDPAVAADGWGLTKAPAGGEGYIVNGQNYRLDKLCHVSGYINDILGSTPGPAKPQWGPNADPNGNATNWAPAIGGVTPVPTPVPVPVPVPAVDLAPLLVRLAVLEGQIKNLQHAEADALDQIHQLDATRVKIDQLPDFSRFAKKGDRVEVSGRISGFGVNRWGGIISL